MTPEFFYSDGSKLILEESQAKIIFDLALFCKVFRFETDYVLKMLIVMLARTVSDIIVLISKVIAIVDQNDEHLLTIF